MNIKIWDIDTEGDTGINGAFSVRSGDFSLPLIGDYRGVELARIEYIPSRPESKAMAREIAEKIAAALS